MFETYIAKESDSMDSCPFMTYQHIGMEQLYHSWLTCLSQQMH
jgi:hypothetical protein